MPAGFQYLIEKPPSLASLYVRKHSHYLPLNEPHLRAHRLLIELGQSCHRDLETSPHLFGAALSKDFRDISLPQETIIQYVDDILICSSTKEMSDSNSIT